LNSHAVRSVSRDTPTLPIAAPQFNPLLHSREFWFFAASAPAKDDHNPEFPRLSPGSVEALP